MTNLKACRLQLRAERCSLDPLEHAHLSKQAVNNLLHHRLFHAAQRVACYLPNDGEVDTEALLLRCWELGKTVCLPVLSRWTHQRLQFMPYTPDDELIPNHFGIPEPRLQAHRLIPPAQLDLVIMPLVGFDSRGTRLGMGGGFYDRSFAYLRRRKAWRKPHLLGLAFSFQQVDANGGDCLPGRQWDVPLNGVVTEEQVMLFSCLSTTD